MRFAVLLSEFLIMLTGFTINATTAAVRFLWLIFAILVLLRRRFCDIKGAFMTERVTRDIYVTVNE